MSFEKKQLTENEVAQFVLTSYVLSLRSTLCLNCGSMHHYSSAEELWTHPTKTAITGARIMRAALTIKPGYDIDAVSQPVAHTPICHDCTPTTGTTHSFQKITPISRAAWNETVKRKAQEAQATAQAAARERMEPKLEDL